MTFRRVVFVLFFVLAFVPAAFVFSASDDPVRVSTGGSSEVSFSAALIEGEIRPEESTQVTYWFEWGPTDALGRNTPRRTNTQSTSFDILVSLTNLNPDTKYFYRLVAEVNGKRFFGRTRSLTTQEFEEVYEPGEPECDDGFDNDGDNLIDLDDPECSSRKDTQERATLSDLAPKVITEEIDTDTTTAVLMGSVTLPRAASTHVWFEWGPTEDTTFRTPTRIYNVSPTFPAKETLPALDARTRYYYRIVAVNEFGLTKGAVEEFRTGNVIDSKPAPASSGSSKTPPSATQPQLVPVSNDEGILQKNPLSISKDVENLTFPSGTFGAVETTQENTLVFRIFLDNRGGDVVKNILIEDIVANNLVIQKISTGSIYNPRTGRILWLIPELGPRSFHEVTFTTKTRTPAKQALVENNASFFTTTLAERTMSDSVFVVIHQTPTPRPPQANIALANISKALNREISSPLLWSGLLTLLMVVSFLLGMKEKSHSVQREFIRTEK